MVTIHRPTLDEVRELEQLVLQSSDPAENVRFAGLYGYEGGLICREYPKYLRGSDGKLAKHRGKNGAICLTVVGTRRLPMRRRQWIETYIRVRAKNDALVPLVLKPAQRRLEAWILRMERAGVPIRIIILKARQMGFSTYIEACVLERVVRQQRVKALVVAHDEETATEVLQMTHTMRDEIPRKGKRWNFGMRGNANYHMSWAGPINGQIKIASAKKKNPGRGFTSGFLHLSEAAFWDDAAKKAVSLLNGLPKLPGTVAIMESTANGASGYFHDIWQVAWRQVDVPIRQRTTQWIPIFFAFFEEPGYCWTKTVGANQGELPDDMALEILNTLQQEEDWLLKQKYFRRWSPDDTWERVACVLEDGSYGEKWRRVECGWVNVNLDQLAWRRLQIRDEFAGDPLRPDTWSKFHEEYPASVQQAFLATGAGLFPASHLQDAMQRTREPIFRGTLISLDDIAGDVSFENEVEVEDFVREGRRLRLEEQI